MGININAKILLSIASIAAAAALVVGATFAFFSDSETSSDNLFQSGTLDLQLKDNNEGFTNGVSDTFVTPDNWAPGDTYTDFICLKNAGSIDIQDIYLAMSKTGETGSTDFKNFINASAVELGAV